MDKKALVNRTVKISSFCQLAETLDMQLFDLTQPTHKASAGFEGKAALITGASSGLPATPYGYAVASGEQFSRCLLSVYARVLLAEQLREVSRGRQR